MTETTSATNLPFRRCDIAAATQLASIGCIDRQGQVRTVNVPGHDTMRLMIVSRLGQRAVEGLTIPCYAVECLVVTDVGSVPCKGHGYGTICYHAAAGLTKAAQKESVKLYWFASRARAERAQNLRQFRGCSLGYAFAKVGTKLQPGMWFLYQKQSKEMK